MKLEDFLLLFKESYPHSEWIITNDEYTYRCKLCGYVIANEVELEPQCPCCGSIMKTLAVST